MPRAEIDGCLEDRSATATPSARLICCITELIDVAWLASRSSMSAKASAFTPVNMNEREKPPMSNTVMMTRCGVAGVKKPVVIVTIVVTAAAERSVVRKPVAAKTRRAMNLVVIAPIAPEKVIRPDWNGVRPKPSCSISGVRKGMAPTQMRNRLPPVVAVRKVGLRKRFRFRIGAGWRLAWRT
ncbi:hypothetical protein AJ87_10370 [Rhizobium yanglingense]|nr:hypothetical protein AJ87_10370 [Rhizobium yanglingense]